MSSSNKIRICYIMIIAMICMMNSFYIFAEQKTDTKSATGYLDNTNRVGIPELYPASKIKKGQIEVQISCSTPGATIYYTTDGTAPSESSHKYTAPFLQTSTAVMRTIAVKPGMKNSYLAEDAYIVLSNDKGQVITVDNSSDTVNGDTSSISALKSAPGSDGISFREAVRAANNTKGTKTIEFSSEISGSTIFFGSGGITNESIVLTSGDLTIDGDINGDGTPDITINGSLNKEATALSNCIDIWSCNNIIKGLAIKDFNNRSLGFACPDPEAKQKEISNNYIVENRIESYQEGGLSFSAMGLLSSTETQTSDISISDTYIADNTIDLKGGGNGIMLVCGTAGVSRNKSRNFYIYDNYISTTTQAIMLNVSDTASDYYPGGSTNPIYYSENNSLEGLFIANNYFSGGGLSLLCANQGNGNSIWKNSRIINNIIDKPLNFGIIIHTASEGGSQRSTMNNEISNIEVLQNKISGAKWSVNISAGEKQFRYPAMGFKNNTLKNLTFKDNIIEKYEERGIAIWAGASFAGTAGTNNNTIDNIIIENNSISTEKYGGGIEVMGGWSTEGPAEGNAIKNMVVRNNNISGEGTIISITGGLGRGAINNTVEMSEMAGNDINGKKQAEIIKNNDDGASNNKVVLINTALPVVETPASKPAKSPEIIKVYIEGKQITMDIAPVPANNDPYVYPDKIFKTLGIQYQWDSKTKTISGNKGKTAFSMKAESINVTVNGKIQKLDSKAVIINSKIMLPLSFFSKVFGYSTAWDAKANTIVIKTTSPSLPKPFSVTTTAFKNKGRIPLKYTYTTKGQNVSIPLSWSNVPKGTKSIAVLMYDLHPIANNWIHWAVVNIPATSTGIAEGVSNTANMPAGSRELKNSFGEKGYGGAAPPAGADHEYRIVVYSLSVDKIDVPDNIDLKGFLSAIKDKVLAYAEISGIYGE